MATLKKTIPTHNGTLHISKGTKKLDKKMGADVLAEVLNNINSAVFVVDKNRHILKYNDMFLKLFGLKNKKMEELFSRHTDLCQQKTFGLNGNYSDNFTEDHHVHCVNCIIKKAIDKAINFGIETNNELIGREHIDKGILRKIYYKYSVKPIEISKQKLATIIIDDISDVENTKMELLEQNIKIKKYNDLFKDELKLANKIQRSIIPKKSFRTKGYEIDFRYFPLGEVGGDFFDFFKIDEKHIGVLICDVMGHGLASSLVTTMVKATIESSRQFFLEPNKLVKYLNNQMIKIFEDEYMTMIYGLIDTSKHNFIFVRAGHPKPWFINKNSVTVMGMEDNIMLGVDKRAKFNCESFHIEKGSKIMIFTDGLTDIGKQNSGYEKELINMVEQYSQDKTEDLLDRIEENVGIRLKEDVHPDDICVLTIERFE